MKAETRASRLIGRPVRDAGGNLLGTVADLITETQPDGRERVTAALVVRRPWGRLLGYERERVIGPWIVESIARRIMRRDAVTVPISDISD